MSLLDGKYEILRQQALGEHQTLFRATAPDGRPVRIVWFDVEPGQERSFERYRRALRRLHREGDTLLRDVVSRPGAHYVVWEDAGDAPPASEDGAWRERLRGVGLDPGDADVRRIDRRSRLAGLAWDGRALPLPHDPGDAAEPVEPERGRPRLPTLPPAAWSWALGGLLTLAAALAVLIGWQRSANDRLVGVPELVGEPVQRVVDRLHRQELRAEPVPRPSDEDPGTVLALEPPSGSELRPGRSVRVLYALPPGQLAPTEVPRLEGRDHPDGVEPLLREAGLEAGAIARVPAEVPAGAVLAQRPSPGTQLGRGEQVDLLLSAGPRGERTFLPELVGLPLEEARALARVAGLPPDRVQVDRVPAPERPTDEVLAQSLAPYQPVGLDEATLRLVVAGAGPAPSPDGMPRLVGLSREAAVERAAEAGVEVEFENVESLALPEGVVLQSPSPGEPTGERWTLAVNAHPLPIPRPGVRAEVLQPRLRRVPYRFLIEPGIPEQTAELWAEPLSGERRLVTRRQVRGGTELEGTWFTTQPGMVRFELLLNQAPYAESVVTP